MEAVIRSINHIARLATLYREKELKKYGLGPMHHTYLLNICRQPGISQEALAKQIFVNKSNVARQLAILEERGYIWRKKTEKDARKLCIYPTKKALTLQPKLTEMLANWNAHVLEGFSEKEQMVLMNQLEKLKERSRLLVEEEIL